MSDYQVFLVKVLPGTYMSLTYISECDLGPTCFWKCNGLSLTPQLSPVIGWACGMVGELWTALYGPSADPEVGFC